MFLLAVSFLQSFLVGIFLAKILFIRILFLAERHFVRKVDSDLHRDGGLIFGFWWHRCGRDVLFVLLGNPLCQPPPPGSSFITLTWETQKDFFHPRALMFSLLESRRAVLFTRYFVAAILFPLPYPFFLPPFSPRVLPFSRRRSRDALAPSIRSLSFFFTTSSRFRVATKVIAVSHTMTILFWLIIALLFMFVNTKIISN